MNRLTTYLHRKLDNFSLDEYIILFVFCSIFLPFQFPLVAILGVLLYLGVKKRLWAIIEAVPRAKFALLFCIITTVVAFLYGNILGGFCGIGITMILVFVFYFRTVINKRLFELLMDVCCIISLFCFAWAMMEYSRIIYRLDYSFLALKVESSPENRINSTFFNANYYSMMIEFIVLICTYKLVQAKTKRRVGFYIMTILLNLFALYLTGTRTAWIPFIVTIPLMFFLNKRYGYFSCSIGGIGTIGLTLMLVPELMQRATLGQDFGKRTSIWTTAIKGIKEHPLFGQGPLTYYHMYKQYNGYPTEHAHSVYLDPILSHGIIPMLIFMVYLGSNLKEVFRLFKRKIDIHLFSLIVGFILTVMIHGILDYTVYWIQTGILFLLVVSSSSMYFQKK